MYNCTCGLINIMKDELMKADSIESVGLIYTKYLQQENTDEKIKEKVIHDLIYDIMDNEERFTLSDTELWSERTKRVEVVFTNSKKKKIEKENELKLNEAKWKEISEKKCDVDWPTIFWALLMAGHIPLLIDARLPKENTNNLLKQAGAKALIANDEETFICRSYRLNEIYNEEPDYSFRPDWANHMIFCSSGIVNAYPPFQFIFELLSNILPSKINH